MTDFRTELTLTPSEWKINYDHKILSVGSCFTENIGRKLQEQKFQIVQNPFGIQYNPASILQNLLRIQENEVYSESELISNNGLWHSWDHHSKFSHHDKAGCLEMINTQMSKAHDFIRQTDVLVITFGTAYIYALAEDGRVVSNCHKFPSKTFNRFRLTVADIVEQYSELIEGMNEHNEKLKWIFTVSPVRHLKDGFEENSISKATLLLAIHRLVDKYDGVDYFPSFELLIDDLRDYRFYEADMVHPSSISVDYIFDKFSRCYFDRATQEQVEAIREIVNAAAHRPFNPQSDPHKKFLAKYLEKCKEISKNYPALDFTKELQYFSGSAIS